MYGYKCTEQPFPFETLSTTRGFFHRYLTLPMLICPMSKILGTPGGLRPSRKTAFKKHSATA